MSNLYHSSMRKIKYGHKYTHMKSILMCNAKRYFVNPFCKLFIQTSLPSVCPFK